MKKIFFAVTLSLLLVPFIGYAHVGSMMDFSKAETGADMMRGIEDQALGDAVHEEMEGLAEKMMQGDMTQEEARRMITLMEEYPGPYGMMMNRMSRAGIFAQTRFSGGHMWQGMAGAAGLWFWMMTLLSLVWLVVGILAVVWLWRKLSK